jgi:Na+/H+ antiporter NhaA
MALFIAALAFPAPRDGSAVGQSLLLDEAKVGVLAASTLAGIIGWLLLRDSPRGLGPQSDARPSVPDVQD